MKLSSREYKLMLHKDKFAGDASMRQSAISRFWQDLEDALDTAEFAPSKRPKLSVSRNLFFLDTKDNLLFKQFDMMLRLRRKCDSSGPWSATLKFRHGDRLLADSHRFRPRKVVSQGAESVSFEEDVKSAGTAESSSFWALFSRSARARIDDLDGLLALADVKQTYARLPPELNDDLDKDLVRVGGLSIVEQVFDGGKIDFAGVQAECAVILWYQNGSPEAPFAAEFSFRFGLDDKCRDCAAPAWRLFRCVQGLAWVDTEGPTKTTLVYGAGKGGSLADGNALASISAVSRSSNVESLPVAASK